MGALAKRCINNRTIRHDAKGVTSIVYCFRKMHLWGSKSHTVYSIYSSVFLSRMEHLFGDDVKNSCPALLYYMREGGGLLRWGFGVVPAIIYHCNVVPVVRCITQFSFYYNCISVVATLQSSHIVFLFLHFVQGSEVNATFDRCIQKCQLNIAWTVRIMTVKLGTLVMTNARHTVVFQGQKFV